MTFPEQKAVSYAGASVNEEAPLPVAICWLIWIAGAAALWVVLLAPFVR